MSAVKANSRGTKADMAQFNDKLLFVRTSLHSKNAALS
jgi:hypothetical protein